MFPRRAQAQFCSLYAVVVNTSTVVSPAIWPECAPIGPYSDFRFDRHSASCSLNASRHAGGRTFDVSFIMCDWAVLITDWALWEGVWAQEDSTVGTGYKMLFGSPIKEDELDGLYIVCGGRGEETFGRKTWRNWDRLKYRSRWENNIKMYLTEYDGSIWTGLICLRIGTSDLLLWLWYLRLWVHKMRGPFWPAEELLVQFVIKVLWLTVERFSIYILQTDWLICSAGDVPEFVTVLCKALGRSVNMATLHSSRLTQRAGKEGKLFESRSKGTGKDSSIDSWMDVIILWAPTRSNLQESQRLEVWLQWTSVSEDSVLLGREAASLRHV